MILKEISDDPISGHGSHNILYNSHGITVMEFPDYLETCGKKECTPGGICFLLSEGCRLTVFVLSPHLCPGIPSLLL